MSFNVTNNICHDRTRLNKFKRNGYITMKHCRLRASLTEDLLCLKKILSCSNVLCLNCYNSFLQLTNWSKEREVLEQGSVIKIRLSIDEKGTPSQINEKNTHMDFHLSIIACHWETKFNVFKVTMWRHGLDDVQWLAFSLYNWTFLWVKILKWFTKLFNFFLI